MTAAATPVHPLAPTGPGGAPPPMPPFALANRVGALGKDWERHFDQLGAALRSEIERLLPGDWNWADKRCLDFGSGAGRALRHFFDLTDRAAFWGCDIHAESIDWLNANLTPMRGLTCGAEPGLELPDESIDLIWATSVFTHLTDHWAGWLVELHRILAPGGLLIATFLGEGMSQAIAGEPWDQARVGINVTSYDESFDVGGPNVLMSPWWIQARWGRAFDITGLEPSGFMGRPGDGHGVVVARKRPVAITVAELERPQPDEPREWTALLHQRTMLYREMTRWRTRARDLEARPAKPRPDTRLPDDVRDVLELVPDLIAENEQLAEQVVDLAREAADLEAQLTRSRATPDRAASTSRARVVMTLLVRDEIDVIRENLDYHLSHGIEHIIATDHLSTDGTTDVLREYEAAGRLTLIREEAPIYDQARWVTRMARLAATEHHADWVINADADEFWWTDLGDLAQALGNVSDDVDRLVTWRYNFAPRPENGTGFLDRMRWRDTRSVTWDGKPMGRKVCHRASPHVDVPMGNHDAGGLRGAYADTPTVEVLHFPWRTKAQVRAKTVNGTQAVELHPELGQDIVWHWRELAARERNGQFDDVWAEMSIDDERLARLLATGALVEDTRLLRTLSAR